jgi:Phytanoyl-CoA dioxygenase (PhyH)
VEALFEPEVDRPLALAGWLPAWDIERRAANLDEVVAWTLARLRAWGVEADDLTAIRVEPERARRLARRLTEASLAPALRAPLHAALRTMLPELPWQHVLVQTYAHFRILCPGDQGSPVRPHVDHGFGHALDERNVWLALTDAAGAGALQLCDLRESLRRLVRRGQLAGVVYEPGELRPVDVRRGDALLFTPLHLHAARAPIEATRVSIDLRIVPCHANEAGPSFSPLWSPR